jgi:ClpP class serine protease
MDYRLQRQKLSFWRLAKVAFWIILCLALLIQLTAPSRLASARAAIVDRIQDQRHSRVIAMIHRQDTISLFGVPVAHSIGIEDSEAILRAVRLTPPEQPIDLILHTPGGLLLAAEQIAKSLAEHKGKVTVFVPHYAMSGGTLLALAADEIVMDPNAVLGPVDPQIGDMPAASILKAVDIKRPRNVSDEMLVLADVASKAQLQTVSFVAEVLLKRLPKEKAGQLAMVLTDGRFTHDFPIMAGPARALGLPVSTKMPAEIYELMDLYPQDGAGRPSVLYIPLKREHPVKENPAGTPRESGPAQKER